MISQVRVLGIQALKDLTVTLEPFTVVVGPNGCGKTTLLRCLAGFFSIGALEAYENGYSGVFADDRDSGTLHQFEQSALRAATSPVGPVALELNGSGLGRVLSDLILASEDNRRTLNERMRRIVPDVISVNTKRPGGAAHLIPVVTFDGVGPIESDYLSEGTLYALALCAVLATRSGSRVLIDDLDKGLHPSAQAEVVHMLRAAINDDPTLQIVVSTHSPYLLQNFEPSEVRLMAKGPDGFAQIRPLTEHPDFEKWKDAMNAGELWASVGEDWVVQGQP
jgi:predicted ATPase